LRRKTQSAINFAGAHEDFVGAGQGFALGKIWRSIADEPERAA
jgi:hypothetical protein